jgi:hypothetical protein
MDIFIVTYFSSWGDDRNCKIVGIYDSFDVAAAEAKKFLEPLRVVYIVKTNINKTVTPMEFPIHWINDYHDIYIVEEEHDESFSQ